MGVSTSPAVENVLSDFAFDAGRARTRRARAASRGSLLACCATIEHLYNWKNVLGGGLLEIGVERGFGALKGLS